MNHTESGCITDVPGVLLGHAESAAGKTGCSVVLVEKGAVAGVDIGGSAPGTRETDMLNPTNEVMSINAIMLTGGSTFGLETAAGVQKYLQEKEIGFRASTGVIVPIVPTAVIFDLDVGKPQIYPDKAMGYEACQNAVSTRSRQGVVGAGYGALCGKILGSDKAMKGGLGTASLEFPNRIKVGVVAVANPWGDLVDTTTGNILVGAKDPDRPDEFLNTEEYMARLGEFDNRNFGMDTTLCVVATNARLTREQATKVAQMTQDGIARCIRPAHTMFDGDVVFVLSTRPSGVVVDHNVIGTVAARLVEQAIVRGIVVANGIG